MAHAGAAIAPFAADGGLDTADGGVVVSVLRFDPSLMNSGMTISSLLNAGMPKPQRITCTQASRKSALIPAW